MRVTFNSFPDTFVRQIHSLNEKQVALQRQLASGQRITTADQDPRAMSHALNRLTEKAEIQTQARNLNRAQAIGEFALSAYEQLKEIGADATQAANRADGLTTPADFDARAVEVNQLLEQALRLVNSEMAGEHLFGGGNRSDPPFVAERDAQGRIVEIVYHGTTDPAHDLTFRIGEGATASPFPRGGENQKLADHLNHLVELRDALGTEDAAAVGALIPGLEADEQTILLNIVETSSMLQGFDITSKINNARFNELENLASRELDVDIAQTIVRLNQMQTAYQAALRAGGTLVSQSLLNYLR